ncbi:MAG TPA: hypothetical protein VMS09_05630 [Paenibacillus sp.]|uniref:hypothetical protein n=1 Tax=Paenibacillus sp. TaxID=58172 RepID=UPI0028D04E92|nr:hypothetical protein [Paenibacillus sp.]HUC91499.1 hypothetical protein [Paenibacillus sp.]
MGCCGTPSHRNKKTGHDHNPKPLDLKPLDLLKIRLAKGEISFEEYEKMKVVLQQ